MTNPRWPPSSVWPSPGQALITRDSRVTYVCLPMEHDEQSVQLGVACLPASPRVATSVHTDAVEAVRKYMESLPEATPFKVEVKSCRFWRAVWTEFLVTLLFLVVGCGAGVQWRAANQKPEDAVGDELKASLALGLTVAALAQCAAPISGCHLNPAVSIALLVTRSISPLRTVSYVLAQCLGAIVGAAILYALTPTDVRLAGLSATVLHPDVHPSQAFGVEFLITLLVLVTLVATYGSRRQVHSCFEGLPVGVAYMVGHLFGYPYTGAGMNPARSLALAVITNSWAHHWVYWVGPILGGIIGGITYDYIQDSSTPNAYRMNSGLRREVTSAGGVKTDPNMSAIHDTEMTVTSNDYRV